MKKIIILPFMVLLFNITCLNSEDTQNKSEVVFILKAMLGNCSKCVLISFDTFSDIKKEFNDTYDIQFIAYIICDREKELTLFKKRYKYIDSVMRYDIDSLPTQNIISDDMLFVFDGQYELIVSFNVYELTNISDIIAIIKTSLNKYFKVYK